MRTAVVVLLVLSAVRPMSAQCANGSPPPCPSAPPARAAAIPIDANRVAVFPFRVTTADSLLGEGFAELLSNEFTGEGSPRAVNMATTINAWRRAGGGLRSPLPLDNARRIARDAGAGLLVEGSIVGFGNGITISASLVGSQDGAVRGVPVKITGAADSLTTLLNRVAAGLLASAGSRHAETGARYSDSTTAMREFIQGLNAWRRNDLAGGVQAFDRAILIDSTFAQALFWRYLATGWGFGAMQDEITRRAWNARTRLSRPQRIVIEAVLGINYPAPRTIEQRMADRRRAAELLGDSPDALYFYGDFMFHYGAGLDPRHVDIAREYLTRAAAIDSQTTVVRHLLEIGLMQRDTALIRQALSVYSRTDAADKWCYEWMAATERRDAAALAALRRRPSGGQGTCRALGFYSTAPQVAAEALTLLEAAASTDRARENAMMGQAALLIRRGRPAAAERVLVKVPDVMRADFMRLNFASVGLGGGLDVEGAFKRVTEGNMTTPGGSLAACGVVEYRIMAQVGAVPAASRDLSGARCPALVFLDSVVRVFDQPGTLESFDSLAHNDVGVQTPGFEGLLLATAWEKRGNQARALRAIRSRATSLGNELYDATWAVEARLALAVGDSTGAARAYRMFADIMREAEPPYAAQRDSARAMIPRLERRPLRP